MICIDIGCQKGQKRKRMQLIRHKVLDEILFIIANLLIVWSEFILPKPKPKKKVAKEPEGQKLFDELVALGLPTRTGE